MKGKEKLTKSHGIRMEDDLWADLEKIAQADGRTTAGFIVFELRKIRDTVKQSAFKPKSLK